MRFLAIFAIFVILFFSSCAKDSALPKSQINKLRYQSVPSEKATLLQVGKHQASCPICGMHLPTFYKTNHAAKTKYGIRQYCSIHCVIEDNEINHTDLKNLQVVNLSNLKFIPALSAYYVVGSLKPATMSRVSKYAFSQKSSADEFAKKHKGKVMKFYDAYEVATKDFTKK